MAKPKNGENVVTDKNAELLAMMAHLSADDIAALPDFSQWSEEQIGFAPYWNPEEGKWFLGTLVARDDRDEDFVRYLVRAEMPVMCKRGPVKEADEVIVKKGEHFSISVYYALEECFNFYLESGMYPSAHVQAIKEVPTKKSGQSVWQWRVKVSPDVKLKLDAKRAEVRELQAADIAERKALQAANA